VTWSNEPEPRRGADPDAVRPSGGINPFSGPELGAGGLETPAPPRPDPAAAVRPSRRARGRGGFTAPDGRTPTGLTAPSSPPAPDGGRPTGPFTPPGGLAQPGPFTPPGGFAQPGPFAPPGAFAQPGAYGPPGADGWGGRREPAALIARNQRVTEPPAGLGPPPGLGPPRGPGSSPYPPPILPPRAGQGRSPGWLGHGRGRWLLAAVALLAVGALAVTGTVLLAQRLGAGPDGAQPSTSARCVFADTRLVLKLVSDESMVPITLSPSKISMGHKTAIDASAKCSRLHPAST